MQTEIDHFLTEQNNLLMQQNSLLAEQNNLLTQQVTSLKNILITYSEVEQSLRAKINQLNTEKEALKTELSKIEQSNFSEQLQQKFQENLKIQLQTQLSKSLTQLDLNSVVSNLVKTELKPIQVKIGTQQTDIEQALSKILQLKVPSNFYEDLEMQSKQINTLGETVDNLTALLEGLKD